jgi:tRNA(Ile)-lysidine synthase
MIIARVRRTLRERGLIPTGARVLVACSGGPDSSALLWVLARLASELGVELEAASVDHGLRADAAADVEIARSQADAVGVPFHALRVQVPAGASVQAQARTARYAALHGLAARRGATRIAVGHTQDDQVETVLMRVLRGASVLGLAGIEPARKDGVIRPLIDCRRADILAFATQHCGAVAHDPSNDDPRFERVRLRKRIVPLLEQEDPALAQHLADLADDARDLADALAGTVETVLAAALEADDTIALSALSQAPAAVRVLALRRWLTQVTGQEPSRSHLSQLELADTRAVEVWLPSGWVVVSDARRLRVSRSGSGSG